MTDNMVELKPCPFPHEVKRGVFLEIDTEDFGFVRGACSDCGCAGPYVTLDSFERVTETERQQATTLWNTRAAIDAPASITDGPNDNVLREAAQFALDELKYMPAALSQWAGGMGKQITAVRKRLRTALANQRSGSNG